MPRRAAAVTRDEFIDKWADRIIPQDGQGVVPLVREFLDDLDAVIDSERSKERRNAKKAAPRQAELSGA